MSLIHCHLLVKNLQVSLPMNGVHVQMQLFAMKVFFRNTVNSLKNNILVFLEHADPTFLTKVWSENNVFFYYSGQGKSPLE